MELRLIRLGDGRRIANGWLVISNGAVRAILTPADKDGAILAFACDGRVRPPDGFIRFGGLRDAECYLRRRLEPGPLGGGSAQPAAREPSASIDAEGSTASFSGTGSDR